MRLFSDMSLLVVDPWLRRAVELAERGRGTTSPNPVVGCVLVRDGSVVGEGFHERSGGPHAETVALGAAAERAHGATAYVTLEPCNHHGKTPPCAPELVRAGVGHVVIGMRDPNPGVTGKGADYLRAAGVDVEFAEDASPFEEQNRGWLSHVSRGMPFVRVKTALTLDGRPALAPGVRSAITGQGARALAMRLRAAADAVMVGAATVAIDDPSLTVRDWDSRLSERQPRRVILARTELPPATARMFGDGHGRPIVLVPEEVGADRALERVARIVEFPIAEGVAGALRSLARHDVVDLLVEAGPRMLTALWDEDLIDELILLHAGGMASDVAPALYVGESQRDPGSLSRRMRALEAGLAGSDAVTVWRRAGTIAQDE